MRKMRRPRVKSSNTPIVDPLVMPPSVLHRNTESKWKGQALFNGMHVARCLTSTCQTFKLRSSNVEKWWIYRSKLQINAMYDFLLDCGILCSVFSLIVLVALNIWWEQFSSTATLNLSTWVSDYVYVVMDYIVLIEAVQKAKGWFPLPAVGQISSWW